MEFLSERAGVDVAVAAGRIFPRLINVTSQHPVCIERPNDLEEMDSSVPHLLEGALANRARVDRVNLEFQPISVPLIVGLEYFGVSCEVTNIQ